MLSELRVRDLGVIKDLTLRFGPGMTVLTGETGAGKTLVVQALHLVTGGRAGAGLVRAGAAEALVEARFVLDGPTARTGPLRTGPATATAGRQGTATPAGCETVLARAVPTSGRSRAWRDGRMVPVAALAEAGAALVDIHGQHEQQSLLSARAQRAALDQFARADLRPVAEARQTVAELVRRMAALGGDERERVRRADLLGYQVAEIQGARIGGPDEDDELAAEEDRLADMATLRDAAATALAALDDGGRGAPGGASDLLGAAVGALGGRPAFAAWEGRLRAASTEVADVAADLRAVVETWEDDPRRLEEVLARRRQLADLRRKYGHTLADVMAFEEEARRDLDELERQEEVAASLEGRRVEAEAAVADAERALREIREEAAPRLAAAATRRLQALAMPDAHLEIAVRGDGAGDGVHFLLGANRGEPAQPLVRVASGGELARTMLALRLVVEGGAPTMLFDEVDAGVGGSAALALAGALREVASARQVLVVTHLPQVAAFADHQVAVRKSDDGGRAATTAEMLDGEGRVVELSRMLSGHPDSSTARAHAQELLLVARGAGASTTRRAPGD